MSNSSPVNTGDMTVIGHVDDLVDAGPALVFDIDPENFISGFAIRYNGSIYCFRNVCPHLGAELDWNRGEFFDSGGRLLICSTHGALFDPVSGRCVKGPCLNQSLSPLEHFIVDGDILVWMGQ